MKKNRLYIFTALVSIMFVVLFNINANAYWIDEDDITKTVDSVKYHLMDIDGEKIAVAYDFVTNEETTELNILSEVDGYKVKSVEAVAKVVDLPNVTVVNIGENVESLSFLTFSGMQSLKKVVLPTTLTYIGDEVFSLCKNLESINLTNVTYIGTSAFHGCSNLKEVTFSDDLETIGTSAFSKTGLESVTIPSKASLSCTAEYYVEFAQFKDCKNLKTVTYKEKETERLYIPQSAFLGCSNLKKVILPKNITELSVSDGAFSGCGNLTAFDFSKVIEIGDSTFQNCAKLQEVAFSENLKEIGCKAFAGTGLKTVTIPSKTVLKCCLSGEYEHNSDDEVGEDMYGQFRDCKKLKTVIFEDREASKFTIPYFAFTNCTALKKVYLPDNAKITIEPRTFKNCTSLSKIYGIENITSIGDAAFAYCKALKEITLSANIKSVGEKAFLGCTKLKRVNLEHTKTAPAFGRKAFYATADGIKFVANKNVAKAVKTNLKNTGTKNAKVYSVSYSKV